jgi:peptidoglycan L-alanyl-D-glutamate endopeptidase CwlK
MPEFSERSKKKLATCDKRLQTIMNELIKQFDVTIVCGYRGQEEQEEAFETGASKLHFPDSKHNNYPSLAVDVIPYGTKYTKSPPFYYMAGLIRAIAQAQLITIRWGGDWDSDTDFYDQTFNDLGHFEIT